MSENNNWPDPARPGGPLNPKIREKLEYALAMHFSSNRMPHMSGDPRNRLSSLQRRNMEDAVTSILEVIGPCLTPAEVEARVKEAEAKIAAGCLISNAAEVADLVALNPDRWRGAINDALTNWLLPIEDHEAPADALRRLIRLEVMAALDPKVSKSAADLVAKAKRDALEEAAKIADSCAADWTKSATGKYLETKWDYESRADAGEEIAAAIRALKGEGDE